MTDPITIEKAENGFVIRTVEENEEGSYEVINVIEEQETEKETVTKLLYWIVENWIYITDDSYGKENLNITWNKKGRKVERI